MWKTDGPLNSLLEISHHTVASGKFKHCSCVTCEFTAADKYVDVNQLCHLILIDDINLINKN